MNILILSSLGKKMLLLFKHSPPRPFGSGAYIIRPKGWSKLHVYSVKNGNMYLGNLFLAYLKVLMLLNLN